MSAFSNNAVSNNKNQESITLKIDSISSALPVLKKDTAGFKFRYVELETIVEKLNPLLDSNGLIYYHETKVVDGRNIIKTVVCDKDNLSDNRVCELVIPDNVVLPGQNSYQALGSAITYFRRYTLLVLFKIITGDDVDVVKPKEESSFKPVKKVNYIEKVEKLMEMGRRKNQLEKYYENNKMKMEPEEIEKIEVLIKNMTDEDK